jgi:hypothetical protein
MNGLVVEFEELKRGIERVRADQQPVEVENIAKLRSEARVVWKSVTAACVRVCSESASAQNEELTLVSVGLQAMRVCVG